MLIYFTFSLYQKHICLTQLSLYNFFYITKKLCQNPFTFDITRAISRPDRHLPVVTFPLKSAGTADRLDISSSCPSNHSLKFLMLFSTDYVKRTKAVMTSAMYRPHHHTIRYHLLNIVTVVTLVYFLPCDTYFATIETLYQISPVSSSTA